MQPQLQSAVDLEQSAFEYLRCSGVTERHPALQLESSSLYYFPFVASGGVSELRASPDCHWPESVHVWDKCLFASVLQQTGEGCAASGRQRGTPRGSLTQAHSLGMGLSVQHKNQNEKDAQLDLNFR